MKLAVLDKDGTLVRPKSGNTFVQSPTDQILIEGVVEACRRWIDSGYTLAIASNQGGVEAGHKSIEGAVAEMQYCMELLMDYGIKISDAMFCPDFRGQKCMVVGWDTSFELVSESVGGSNCIDLVGKFRKPCGGMLESFKRSGYENKEYESCWMIGDREEDMLAAEAAGFKFLDADTWRKETIENIVGTIPSTGR